MAKHKYTMEDWRAVRKGLDAGGTIRGVAAETGISHRILPKVEHPVIVFPTLTSERAGAYRGRPRPSTQS